MHILSSCLLHAVKKIAFYSKMIPRLNQASRPWSRSSLPILAQVVLVLATCIEMDLVQHVQCANYTVGAGFTDLNVGTGLNSTWTNTVNGLVKPDVLEAAYQQWANSVNITAGDTLSKFLLLFCFHGGRLLVGKPRRVT